jgi:hypothetical protein
MQDANQTRSRVAPWKRHQTVAFPKRSIDILLDVIWKTMIGDVHIVRKRTSCVLGSAGARHGPLVVRGTPQLRAPPHKIPVSSPGGRCERVPMSGRHVGARALVLGSACGPPHPPQLAAMRTEVKTSLSTRSSSNPTGTKLATSGSGPTPLLPRTPLFIFLPACACTWPPLHSTQLLPLVLILRTYVA